MVIEWVVGSPPWRSKAPNHWPAIPMFIVKPSIQHFRSRIRPHQPTCDKHHDQGRREMNLKALAGWRSGHGSRSLMSGATGSVERSGDEDGGVKSALSRIFSEKQQEGKRLSIDSVFPCHP